MHTLMNSRNPIGALLLLVTTGLGACSGESTAIDDNAPRADAVADILEDVDASQASDADEDAAGTQGQPDSVDATGQGVDAGAADVSGGDASGDVTAGSDSAAEDAGPTDPVGDDATEQDPTDVSEEAADAPTETEDDASFGQACITPCDCDNAGEDCVDGLCTLTSQPALCCDDEVCPDGLACTDSDGTPGLCGTETSDAFGLLIINEVLVDGTVNGDPNGDGDTSDAVGDEFIELVNIGADALDIGGFTILEASMPVLPRHTFDAGTVLAPGEAVVVFGGGTAPDDIDGARFVVANAQDPGIPLGLALNNDGDAIQVLDAQAALAVTFSYGPGSILDALSDQSYCRSPELTGDFVAHNVAADDPEALFSPGTKADGSSF